MTEKAILSEIHLLPENLKLEVLHFISFLKSEHGAQEVEKPGGNRVFGRTKRKYKMSPDFDAPLDDFKDYM